MAITNRNLPAGTRLVAKYKGQTVHAKVVEGGFVITDPGGESWGEIFKSPSSAGSSVMGGIACNGWRFWSVDGEEPATLPPTKGNTPPAASKPTKQARAFKLITRVANQHGVEEGKVRWWCSACCASFLADAGTTPDECPEGHRADDEELTGAPRDESAAAEEAATAGV